MRARNKALTPPEKEKELLDSGKLTYSHADDIRNGFYGNGYQDPEPSQADVASMREMIEDGRREAHSELVKAGAKDGEDLSRPAGLEKVSKAFKTLRTRHA